MYIIALKSSIHFKLNKQNQFFTNYISLHWYYYINSTTLIQTNTLNNLKQSQIYIVIFFSLKMYLPAYNIPFNVMVYIAYKIYKRLTDNDQNPCQWTAYTINLYNIIFYNYVIYLELPEHKT